MRFSVHPAREAAHDDDTGRGELAPSIRATDAP